ncbi:hypothetical protein C7M61_000043 [Candidozyma pseudohaemuli]|uniref:alcohol dehydrogenase n=1 Tax=Candidozyma pseudohaemuli TaxID=418784 RepID=A0A2P7YWQ5_9ASCO|nr:hypothetical protein C7M61_000043 [[Candida] pseudohaemulonii]PSK40406.1 hypothetical protein C7M61_000043 [[Candida] pseudohaemulonii]
MLLSSIRFSARRGPVCSHSFVRFKTSIPRSQKAVVYETHGGPLLYRDVPVPKPKPNELLVNVKYSGVCHSDLHLYKGEWPFDVKLPLIGGHEGAGEVVAIGEAVKGWKIGDLAGVKWLNSSCQLCEYCVSGHEPVCPSQVISGCHQDGTFQQYTVADAIQAAKIPKGTDLAEVAPILCAGLTAYKALKRTEARPGNWIAVVGAGGGLGSLAVQYAKAMGFMVLGIDGGKDKTQWAKSLGAHEVVDFTTVPDLPKTVVGITGGGAHGVVNVSASLAALQQSFFYVRPTGTVVLVGIPGKPTVDLPVLPTVGRNLKIVGSVVGNRKDTQEAVEFFTRGLVQLPVKVAGLSELPRIFEEMDKGIIMGRYSVDTSR